MLDVVHELAPAKLNLALSVGPLNADGMHPIASWMITIDLHDELEVRPLQSGSLSRYAIYWHDEARRRTDIDWPIRNDLAVRAHLALQEHVGRELPVQLKLAKRIPVGGGLGGGSSNAAAMLRAVNRLYKLGLSNEQLAAFGASIGSDVSFLVTGGSATVTGVGETIQLHQQKPSMHVVVVLPEQSCATAAVYQRFDELAEAATPAKIDVIEQLQKTDSTQMLAEALFNDLAVPAVSLVPQLRAYQSQLAELAERPAHITGSGSSLFIICDDPLHAEALASAVEQQLNLPAVAVNSYEAVHEHAAG